MMTAESEGGGWRRRRKRKRNRVGVIIWEVMKYFNVSALL